MKKYLLLFCFLPFYFSANSQCADCANDVSIGTLTQCSPAFFDLTDIIDSLPLGIMGDDYNFYRTCGGNGSLSNQITDNCSGGNANKCVTNFDIDEDADNVIYIEVNNSGSCDTTFKFNLFEIPTPTIAVNTASGPSACNQSNGSISFNLTNVPDGPDTIFWVGGSQITTVNSGLATIINLDNLMYTDFTINVDGCVSQEDVDVELMDPPGPTPTITGPTEVCSGGQVTLDAGGGFTSYSWSDSGGTMQTATYTNITTDKTYTVTVTAANQCTGTDTHMVTVNSLPTVAINGAATNGPTTCGGSDGQIGLTFTNVPNGNYTVTWTGAGTGSQMIAVSGNVGLIANLGAGNYNDIKITVNGCTSTNDPDQILTDPTGPSLTINGSTTNGPTTCGGSDGQIGLTFTNVPNGNYTVTWTGAGTGSQMIAVSGNVGLITNLGSGTYTDIKITVNGCTSTNDPDQTLSDPPSPTVAIDVANTNNPTTCGGEDGNIGLTLTNVPNGTYTVTWSGAGAETQQVVVSNNMGSIMNLVSGDYNNIKITVTGCTSTTDPDQTLSDPPTPTIAIDVANTNDPTTCGGTDGKIGLTFTNAPNGTYTVTWTGAGAQTQQVVVNNNSGSIMNLTAGIYNDIKISVAGCNSINDPDRTLNDPPTPTIAIDVTNTNDPTTCGGTDGKIGLTFTNAPNGTYTVTWTGAGAQTQQVVVTNNKGAILNLAAGAYNNIKITIAACTSIEDPDRTLNDPPTPTIAIDVANTNDPTTCGGTDGKIGLIFTNLPGNGTYTVTWTGAGAQTQQVVVTNNKGEILNLAAGAYDDIRITVAACTSIEDPDRTLNDPNAPTPGTPVGTNPTTCNGSDGFIDISGLIAGETYAVTYTDNGSPVGPVNITADGSGTVTITGLDAGLYNNFNFNLANCTGSSTGSVTLSDPDSPAPGNPSKTNPTNCGGSDGTISISGLLPNTNYSVSYTDDGNLVGPINLTSNGSGVVLISGLNAGDYTAFSFTLNGCNGVNNTVVTLEDPNSPTCSASSNSPICEGTDLQLMASTNGGGASTFQWSGPGGFTSTQQNPIRPAAVPAFSGTYNLTVTKNGCECTTSTTVVVHPEIVINSATEMDPLCNGDLNGVISLNVSGGTGSLNYAWSSGQNTNPLENIGAGSYIVTITDSGGACSATDSYTLVDPLAITISNSPIIKSCENASTGAIDISVSGGVSADEFLWSNGEITEDLVNISAGTYTVTVTDDNFCTKSATYSVTAFPPINNQITGDLSFCEGVGGEICAADNANYTYEWNDGTTTACISFISPQTFTVTITQNNPGNNLCEEVVSSTVIEIENPNGNIDVQDPDGNITDGELCQGSQATLTASANNYSPGDLNYAWNTGSFDQSINVPASGNFEVTISESQSGLSCQNIVDTDILVYVPPSVTNLNQLNNTNEINEIMFFGADIQEESNQISSYNWSISPDPPTDYEILNPPPTEQLEIIFDSTGLKTICLTVDDTYGCASVDCTTKAVKNPGDCGINSLVLSSAELCPGDLIEVTATAERSASASKIVTIEFIINGTSQGVETVNSTAVPYTVTREFGPFFNPDDYTIEFIIVDDGFPEPCSSTLSKSFSLLPEPSIEIIQDNVAGCAGQPIKLDYEVTYFPGYGTPSLLVEIKDEFGNVIATPTTNQTGMGQMNITFNESGTYTITKLEDQTNNYCDVIDNFDSFEVSVFDAIEAVEPDFECDNTGAIFVYTFEITGGDQDYTLISGVGEDDTIQLIDGKWIYTSDTLTDGSPVNVTIGDGSSCTNLVFNSPGANNTCQCALSSNTGTILVQGGNGNVCETDTVFFSHDYSGVPAELEGFVEIWYYVLRDVPFDPANLNNIVYFTQNDFITFPSGNIKLDTTYSIMPIIGFPDGTGSGVDFFNSSCLSFEGDAKEFRFFSNPTPQVSVDESIFCENSSNKEFDAINLVGGGNDNVLWSLEGGQDKHFYPSAAEEKVYISFPDSLYTSGETVNISLTENKQYTAVDGVCSGTTNYSFVVSDQAAPNQGEIYWWPGDILVSTIQDACYQWGFISGETEQGLTDGDDDRFLFVPGGIAEIDQSETPEKIYFVDIFFKDGTECNLSSECKTRTYYNSPGPPQLQIGHGDENEFLVYPNPSDNIFNLRVRGEWGGEYNLEVYNQMVRRIQTQTLEKNYWTLTGTIDLNTEPAGVYYLVSTNDAGERKVVKIVKTL